MSSKEFLKQFNLSGNEGVLKKDQLEYMLDKFGEIKWQEAQASAKNFSVEQRNKALAYHQYPAPPPIASFTPYNKK